VFLWIACCVAGVLALASGEARAAPLRPDLAITSVTTNRVSLVGRPFYVSATVIERSRRVGARARITVTANDIALATKNIVVRPGRRLVVKLPVALAAPGKTRLVTAVTGTKPVEAVISNNVRRVTVDVAEFRARWSSVVVPSFGGYGGQFNHHVYSALSRAVGINDTNVVDMEQKMRALHPQFSRIFFTSQAFTDPDKMQSFVRTVLFAQSTGTTINITWQGGTLSVASGTVQKFANVLLDLVRNRGVTNLRWLTLQNEPNRTRMTMQQYETQYRELDAYIQSIRGQVRYMGGDLVRAPDGGAPNQAAWFQYMASRMSDILDAYSIHVFWDYWDTQKLVDRLKEVRAIVNTLPQQARKPIYVTEYGVRGLRVFNGAPQVDPGVWQDGSAIGQTNVSAFQQAWFDVLAANLGYVATSKWDSYFGRYDNTTQAYYFIGDPQNGWPLYPLYNLVQLLTTTVKREWKVAAVDSVPATSRLLGAYLGKNGQQTMVGLDTAGAQLNTASPTPISYSIAGLPPLKTLQLVVWNEAGNGLVGPARSVSTDAAGVASITVPQQGVFVLTTLRLPSS
jgi:Glycosyl hydrolase catalytic core